MNFISFHRDGQRKYSVRALGNALPIRRARFAVALVLCAYTTAALAASAQESGLIDCMLERTQDHGQTIIGGLDQPLCFEAYVSNFDTGRQRAGQPPAKAKPWGIPHWVLQRVERAAGAAEGYARPPRWFSVPDLLARRLAPTDDSYRFTQRFRSRHADWYERGHLAQKYLAERLRGTAGWFTHNVANAVPQRGRFNKGPWLTLECYTGAWANSYAGVWILTGPVFIRGYPSEWLRSDARARSMPVAIPDELFKIVARRTTKDEPWSVLAFLYPQEDDSYRTGPWNPKDRLTSVDQIELLTGLDLFPGTSPGTDAIEAQIPDALWPVDRNDFDKSCRRFAPETP